ncbi:MAG: hypothetical protein O7C75_11305 [Verrucomicrobia bacterium]|nr:hypothetical protein [Verrucomicrobiota bacterium]
MKAQLKIVPDTVGHIEKGLSIKGRGLDKYRAMKHTIVQETPLRYHLEELRNSKEFIYTTQTIVTQIGSVSSFLQRTAQNSPDVGID